MALLLAEISDKMPSVLELWRINAVLSIPVLFGLAHKWMAWFMLSVATTFSAGHGYLAYREAFFSPGVSDSVQRELGNFWIANSIASAYLPALIALGILCWHLIRRGTKTPSIAHHPASARVS